MGSAGILRVGEVRPASWSCGGLMATIAENIRWRRLDLGMSQAELAAAVGLGRTSVVNIEAHRQAIPVAALTDFAEALETWVGWLVEPHPGLVT